MKFILICLFISSGVIKKGSFENIKPFKLSEFPEAIDCIKEDCVAPKCRCSETVLDSKLNIKKIPQLVAATFDDAITALNYDYVQKSIAKLKNPDGCNAQATFYVSHEYTDYVKLHDLWQEGHEIALHSITHTALTSYWNSASTDLLIKEFGGQLEIISKFGKIKRNDMKGIRVPLFELAGDNSFIAMKKLGLMYDASWPTSKFIDPGMWPYSLDYKSTQDCNIGVCPTASVPDIWVHPLINWQDKKGLPCAMMDACVNMPKDNIDDIFDWMVENFNRTYHGNRAPFGLYLHASWFLKGNSFFPAYQKFLEYLNKIPDVYMVSVSRIIDYIRNPREGKPFDSCVKREKTTCTPTLCQLIRTDIQQDRWMHGCVPCPEVYPWLDNPHGKKPTDFE